MKNIFKTLIPCLVLALGVSSCYDEMDDKATVDAQYALATTPTVALSSAVADDHSSATITATISSVEGVVESGFMYAGSSDFSGAKAVIVENAATITTQLTGLAELTTYYVKAYAFLGDGRLVYSEPTTFTTKEAPSYSLDGTYVATEYDAQTGKASAQYEITIAFVEGSETEVEITNIWEGEKTVKGTFDAATNTVTIPTNQLIYVHSSYGDVLMRAVNDEISAYTSAVVCKFTPKGGMLVTSNWGAVCSAGSFGYFYISMTHK